MTNYVVRKGRKSLRLMLSTGLLFIACGANVGIASTKAQAATVSPNYAAVCGVIAGNYLCGTQQWMQAAQTAANNEEVAATAAQSEIKKNLCSNVAAAVDAFSVLLAFLSADAIAGWVVKVVAGVTVAEVLECGV